MLRSIRENRGGEGVRMLGGRIVTLWGLAIKEVLDKSADVYDSGPAPRARACRTSSPTR